MIPAITLGKAEEEAYYRVITPAYAGTPLSGAGAARQGGRFNRLGQEALYLSTDEATALAEYKQDNPWLPPGTICTFFIRRLRVADWWSTGVRLGPRPSYAYTTRAVRYGKLHHRLTSEQAVVLPLSSSPKMSINACLASNLGRRG